MFERPHTSFTRTNAERDRRPDRIERFGFDDLIQSQVKSRRRTGREGADIVTVEAAREGDTQVLAAAEPRTNPPGPPVALDRLARLPSVASVVASTEVRLTSRLPSIVELLMVDVGPPAPEPEVLAHLPKLQSLHAMVLHPRTKLSLSALSGHDLRELAVRSDRLESGDIVNIGGFTELRRLALNAGAADSVEAVGRLRRLEYLYVDGGRGGWSHLAGLERLREAVLWDVRLADLRPLAGWSSLKALWLRGRNIKSLDGIGAMSGLELLSLDVLGTDDLIPLTGLSSLRELTLSGPSGGWSVKSLAHLAGLKALKRLTLRDVSVSAGDIASLSKAHPELRIDSTDSRGPGAFMIGPVEVRPPSPSMSSWSIFQDLTDLLGTETNDEAESRLRRALATQAPDLLGRLSFDTESGAVEVRADSEAGIRQVVEVIIQLARESH